MAKSLNFLEPNTSAEVEKEVVEEGEADRIKSDRATSSLNMLDQGDLRAGGR